MIHTTPTSFSMCGAPFQGKVCRYRVGLRADIERLLSDACGRRSGIPSRIFLASW